MSLLDFRRPWVKGEDGQFHPQPPYVEGERVGCEGCGRLVRVTAHAAHNQFVYEDCKPCGRDYDAYVESWGRE